MHVEVARVQFAQAGAGVCEPPGEPVRGVVRAGCDPGADDPQGQRKTRAVLDDDAGRTGRGGHPVGSRGDHE